jgi:hypothetical protein
MFVGKYVYGKKKKKIKIENPMTIRLNICVLRFLAGRDRPDSRHSTRTIMACSKYISTRIRFYSNNVLTRFARSSGKTQRAHDSNRPGPIVLCAHVVLGKRSWRTGVGKRRIKARANGRPAKRTLWAGASCWNDNAPGTRHDNDAPVRDDVLPTGPMVFSGSRVRALRSNFFISKTETYTIFSTSFGVPTIVHFGLLDSTVDFPNYNHNIRLQCGSRPRNNGLHETE